MEKTEEVCQSSESNTRDRSYGETLRTDDIEVSSTGSKSISLETGRLSLENFLKRRPVYCL